MTRLTVEDLNQGPSDLKSYDQALMAMTGMGLLELALKTSAVTLDEFRHRASTLGSVAVIPMTTGQGLLPGFSEKIAEVAQYLGLPCKVTKAHDVAGLGEAVARGSEILICADDDTFLVLDLVSRRIVDNAAATGEVYAAALIGAFGRVTNCSVGVLGLGPVGRASADYLYSKGFQVIVHDRSQKIQSGFLVANAELRGVGSVDEVLGQTNLILDATTSSDIIKVRGLKRRLILAAPGIPLGIDDPHSDMVSLIHDPLQLGVAAMLAQALA